MAMIIPANLLRLMDPATRTQYERAGWLPEEALVRVTKALERQEHSIVAAWLGLHQIEFIHASPVRKVRDLPLGWPDFTVFYGGRALLLEMKVEGGRLRDSQIARAAALLQGGTEVFITEGAANAIERLKAWLAILGWSPQP